MYKMIPKLEIYLIFGIRPSTQFSTNVEFKIEELVHEDIGYAKLQVVKILIFLFRSQPLWSEKYVKRRFDE